MPIVDDRSGEVLGCKRCKKNCITYCTLVEICGRCKQDGQVCTPVVSSVTNQRIGCDRCIRSKFRDCSLYQKCERCEFSGEECIPFFPYNQFDWGYPRFLIGCRACCKEDCFTPCSVSECHEDLYQFQDDYKELYGDGDPDWSVSERTPPQVYMEHDEDGVPIEEVSEVETPTVVDFTGTTLTLATGNLFDADTNDDHVSIGAAGASVEAKTDYPNVADTTDDHDSIRATDATVKATSPPITEPPTRVMDSQQSAITSTEYNALLHPYAANDVEPEDSVQDSLSEEDNDEDCIHFDPSDNLGPCGGVKSCVDLDFTHDTMSFANTSCTGDANLFTWKIRAPQC